MGIMVDHFDFVLIGRKELEDLKAASYAAFWFEVTKFLIGLIKRLTTVKGPIQLSNGRTLWNILFI